jgi:N-acetylglutamate synthase-like GNAT family acetyltransferase
LSLETNGLEDILIRSATPKDVDEIRRLVIDHGTTQGHLFPREDLEKHLVDIASGTDHALLAFDKSTLVGMVSFTTGSFYSEYESVTSKQEPTGYIVEALVHSDFTKRGIGTQLLERAKAALAGKGVSSIYAKRHEENRASEALMRKAGFQLIDVFPDPRRTSGSRRTAIERFRVKS